MNLPTITIELDRPRQWKFSANATIAFYRALGKDAFDRLKVFQPVDGESDDGRARRSMEELSDALEVFIALLWCGLLGDDPKITREQIGEMIGPSSIPDLLPRLLESMNESISGNPTKAPAEAAALTASG